MMATLHRLVANEYTTVTDQQSSRLARPGEDGNVVEIHPPRNNTVPGTIPDVVRGIREFATDWSGLRNRSGIIAFELRRSRPDQLRFQYRTPSNRVDRQLRSHMLEAVPGVSFAETGTSGLPISTNTSVGGALVTTQKEDYYPLRTGFDSPPLNAVVGLLHPEAMQRTTVIVQILCQPLAGRNPMQQLHRRLSQKQIDYLRSDTERVWGTSTPTRRDRQQAEQIASKTGQPLWRCSIRVLVIGADEYTQARVREVTTGFNRFENAAAGQQLVAKPVRHLRRSHIYRFATAVADRRFGQYGRPFTAATDEVGALLAVPDRDQRNITVA